MITYVLYEGRYYRREHCTLNGVPKPGAVAVGRKE